MKHIHWKVLNVFTIITFLCITSCSSTLSNSKDSIVNGEMGMKLDTILTPYIKNIITAYDLPGVAVGIVKDNTIVYAKAYGHINTETKEPLKLTSMFHMASVSKPFVATAIMQLVEQNKIHLDSTIVSYLPYFKLDDDQYKNITIKQMLNHISGMPDVQDYEWHIPTYDEGALEQYVRSISSKKMQSAPDENFAYSNMAFDCLGDVIAKVSGMSFAEYEKKYILNPSGMHKSTFLKPDYLPENWAAPHTRIVTAKLWDEYPYNRMHGPSSTLHSNIIEMCNWAMINLNRGSYKGNTILNPDSYDLLWKPWFQNGEDSYIGLSWFLSKFRNENTIGHSGGDTGFRTDFIMLPEKNVSIIVLCNLSPAPVENITYAAIDIILGFEPNTEPKPASIPVCKELEKNGLSAAVTLWDSLKINHTEEYDFHPQHFVGLFIAMDMDRVEDAKILAQLCVNIFPDDVLNYIKSVIENYYSHNPENQAAPAILDIIMKK